MYIYSKILLFTSSTCLSRENVFRDARGPYCFMPCYNKPFRVESTMAAREDIIICAHRGAPTETPENTMASFRHAQESGAKMIEMDLRRTADGRGVVIHDKTVNRTTNATGRVDSFSEDRIRELDAGAWFASRFAGQRIPLLDEVLEWASGAGAVLNVELKDPEIMEFAVRRIQAHDLLERVMLSSWHIPALAEARKLEPGVRIAPILFTGRKLRAVARELKPNAAMIWSGPALTPKTVSAAVALGVPVLAWLVNTRKLLDRVLARGVEGVITDEVGLVTAAMNNSARKKDKST